MALNIGLFVAFVILAIGFYFSFGGYIDSPMYKIFAIIGTIVIATLLGIVTVKAVSAWEDKQDDSAPSA
jgi:hypothetical protein